MSDYVPVSTDLLDLTLEGFTTVTPVDYTVMNAVWTQLLSNDAFLNYALLALTAALAGKANLQHGHAISEIGGLQDILDNLTTRVNALAAGSGTGGGTDPGTGTGGGTPTVTPVHADIDVQINGSHITGTAINVTGDAANDVTWEIHLLNTGEVVYQAGPRMFSYDRPAGKNNTQFNVVLKMTDTAGGAYIFQKAFSVPLPIAPPLTVRPNLVTATRDGGYTDTNAAYAEGVSWLVQMPYTTESDVTDSGQHVGGRFVPGYVPAFTWSNVADPGGLPTSTTLSFRSQTYNNGNGAETVHVTVNNVEVATFSTNEPAQLHTVQNVPNYNGAPLNVKFTMNANNQNVPYNTRVTDVSLTLNH